MTAHAHRPSSLARRLAVALLAAVPVAGGAAVVLAPAAIVRAADEVPKKVGPVSFVLPAGWTLDDAAKPMRLGTINVGEGAAKAEVVVSSLAGNFGSPGANVNRWRGMAGLPPVGEEEAAKGIAATKFAGIEGKLYDSGEGQAKRVVVAFGEKDGKTYFFRLVGPAETVGKQRAAFDTFLGSVKID